MREAERRRIGGLSGSDQTTRHSRSAEHERMIAALKARVPEFELELADKERLEGNETKTIRILTDLFRDVRTGRLELLLPARGISARPCSSATRRRPISIRRAGWRGSRRSSTGAGGCARAVDRDRGDSGDSNSRLGDTRPRIPIGTSLSTMSAGLEPDTARHGSRRSSRERIPCTKRANTTRQQFSVARCEPRDGAARRGPRIHARRTTI